MGLTNGTGDDSLAEGISKCVKRPPARAMATDQTLQSKRGQIPDGWIYPFLLRRAG